MASPEMDDDPTASRAPILRAALPLLALVVFEFGLLIVLGSAGDTLGYDFDAYRAAAVRVLDGLPLYEQAFDVPGDYLLYLYPPPFVLLFLPFAVLPAQVAVLAWIALLIGAFLAGVIVLPVRREVRWAILLLGGLSWPLMYSLKLGQVGTILFVLFAAGWRWMDRPIALGLAIAVGSIVKLQPLAFLGWALVTRRLRAAAVALVTLLAVSVVATLLVGLGAWGDYVALLRTVSEPVTTPHNFTPGAALYQLGMPVGAASAVQWLNVAAVVVLVGWSWLRLGSVPSYLATVIGSQLVSPLLWDHYALLLLLPVAWLLERGRRWAVVIPLATWLPLALVIPAIVYPVVFWVSLVAVIGVGLRDERPAPQGARLPASVDAPA